MNVQHSPGKASNSKALPKCNNEERQWFAKAHGRVQVMLMQVEGLSNNASVPEEELKELAENISNLRRDYTKQWDAIAAKMRGEDRSDALGQAMRRWSDMEKRLSEAERVVATRRGAAKTTQQAEITQSVRAKETPKATTTVTRTITPRTTQPNQTDWQLQWDTMQRQWEERHRKLQEQMEERERRRDAASREQVQRILLEQDVARQEAVEAERRAFRDAEERWRLEVGAREKRVEELQEQINKLTVQYQKELSTEKTKDARKRLIADWEESYDATEDGHPGELQAGSLHPGELQAGSLYPGERRTVPQDLPGHKERSHHWRAAQRGNEHVRPSSLPSFRQNYNPYHGGILERFAGELARPHRRGGEIQDSVWEDEDDDYYQSQFPQPFDQPPSKKEKAITEYRKLEGLAPKFSGKEEEFAAWVALYVPVIHRARCPVAWKASVLAKSLDANNETLRDIIEGAGASSQDYAKTINRLVREFGHPQGMLAARLKNLCNIKEVTAGDYRTIRRWLLRLEDYIDEAMRMGQRADVFGSQLYETNFGKMDRELRREYLQWIRIKNLEENAVTLCAWLEETVRDSRRLEIVQDRTEDRVHIAEGRSRARSSPPGRSRRPNDYNNRRTRPPCPLDGQQHGLVKCEAFLALKPQERRAKLKELKRCYLCFSAGHNVKSCTRDIKCAECERHHHTLLHNSNTTRYKQQRANIAEAKETRWSDDSSTAGSPIKKLTAMNTAKGSSPGQIALQTLPIDVYYKEKRIRLNCLLDQGATGAFMSRKAAEAIRATGHTVESTITGFDGAKTQGTVMVVSLQVSAAGERRRHWIEVQVTKDPVASYKPVNWAEAKNGFAHLKHLPIKPPVPDKDVDIMLGMDTPQLISSLIPDVGGEDERRPIARLTRLGWVVGGPTRKREKGESQVNFAFNTTAWLPHKWTGKPGLAAHTFTTHGPDDARDIPNRSRGKDDELQAMVARMWEVDVAYGEQKTSIQEDRIFETLRREMVMKNGKYEMPTLWKLGHPNIGNNFRFAERRLESLLKSKQFRQEGVRDSYNNQIQEWQDNEYTEEVKSASPEHDQAYYLPHFAVVRWDKTSSQVRIVMDAAAKAGRIPALNQCLLKGPKLINELVSVLMNFRRRPVAIAADIKKMFFQVKMRAEDRDYHRFLWKTDTGESKVFRWTVHPFGSAASPCIAIFVIKEHARRHRKEFPRAAETVINSTLVDDNLDSCNNAQEAIELGKQLVELYKKAGMSLGKIISNKKEVLQAFPTEMAAPSLDIAQFCQEGIDIDTMKALGIVYLPEEDVFSFTFEKPPEEITKRSILKHMAKLYDPHGLIGPHTVQARLILRRMWQEKLDWDQEATREIQSAWKKWVDASVQLPRLRIPRCFQPDPGRMSIHVFADASGQAYAAAAYCVGDKTSRLMMSKARVAPLKPLSIPRLELLGAELAAEMGNALRLSLKKDLEEIHYWTDSTNVLAWLNTEDRALQSFVANRTSKIREITKVSNWRWVNTENNPADIPSRGALVTALHEKHLWWEGPRFLVDPSQEWPEQPGRAHLSEDAQKEMKKGAAFKVTAVSEVTDQYQAGKDHTWPTVGSWTKLLRVVAWAQLFIRRCQKQEDASFNLHKAKQEVIKTMQKEGWPRSYHECTRGELRSSSTLTPLAPFIDHNGIMRLKGRHSHRTDLTFNQKHQMLIPSKHPWTELLVRHVHQDTLHQGTQHVLAELRTCYWIVRGSQTVRRVVAKCVACKRQRPVALQPSMGPIPEERLPQERCSPFTHTALDAAGPVYTREGKDQQLNKSYFIIFTCLTYRAVHLEDMENMSASGFLEALDRFTARRGKPVTITSDNGSNFVAGANELRKFWKQQESWSDSRPDIEWRFIPPKAPHMGGTHERLIGATKRTLYHIFRPNTAPTRNQLRTALTVVEGILNSRPINYVSTDHKDPEPITPGHFLGSTPYQQLAKPPGGAWDSRMAWRRLQDRLDVLWKRLVREMKGNLQVPKKWHQKGRNLQAGDVVVMMEEKQRGLWPLGRIIRTEPSRDGIVRKVHVLTGGHTMRRPANIMMLLLPGNESVDVEEAAVEA